MATFQGVIIWEAHSHWSFMIWHNSKHQTSEKSVTRMAAQWFHHIIYIHINVCILLYNAHLYIFVVSHYLSIWRKYGNNDKHITDQWIILGLHYFQIKPLDFGLAFYTGMAQMETAFGLRNSGTEASDWALSLGAYSGRGEPGNPAEMEKSRHSGFRPSPPSQKKNN